MPEIEYAAMCSDCDFISEWTRELPPGPVGGRVTSERLAPDHDSSHTLSLIQRLVGAGDPA